MEYIVSYGGSRGNLVEYELLYDGEGDAGKLFLMGLLDSDTLKNAGTTESMRGYMPKFAGSSRPQSGSKAGGYRGDEIGMEAKYIKASEISSVESVRNARHPVSLNQPSYMQMAEA
jgi:hypothetical protein